MTSTTSTDTSTAQPSQHQAPLVAPPQKTLQTPFFSSVLSPQVSTYFIAGGIAGATSRTVVSPLERIKIIQQVQPTAGGEKQYRGVWSSLARIWREEGFVGFMRGNGINCLRIVPYSAVQFTTYEQLKKLFTNNGEKTLNTPIRLTAGALAGITSVCTTYPLDLVRSRLSIATASIPVQHSTLSTISSQQPSLVSGYHTASTSSKLLHTTKHAAWTPKDLTMWGMTLKVMREEGGVLALYRGMIPTAVGVAPYVGINFAAYEALRGIVTPPDKSTVVRKLACGALAGAISQTLTYPFDVLRRKMQVRGMGTALGPQYNGALHALVVIVRNEGIAGLYRGIWANLLKVAPSIATSFFTYEFVKEKMMTVP